MIPNILKSSKNNGTLSRTLKGAVVLITLVLASLNIDIPEAVLYEAIEAVALAISALYTAYGAVVKIYNKTSEVKI